MKKILVATHGNFAQGSLSAASIILGEKEHVSFINAYTPGIVLKDELETYFRNQSKEDVILVLTDMFGGSVNQAIMPYTLNENVHLITGFNLALLLEMLLLDEAEISAEKIRTILEQSKQQIMYVNDVLHQSTKDDFDF